MFSCYDIQILINDEFFLCLIISYLVKFYPDFDKLYISQSA